MHNASETTTVYVNDPFPFLQSVLGACSITKTVLQDYNYIQPDPYERQNDYRSDMARMYQLCRAEEVPDEPLAFLEELLDLFDLFVAQGRRVTAEQEALAQPLNREYIAWCEQTFFTPAA